MRIPPSIAVVVALAACTEAPSLGQSDQASTVASHVETSCSTDVVLGLSRQIAAEVGCMAPGQLVTFPEGNGIAFQGAAVLPYVSEDARADLLAAVAAGGGRTLELTSAYRTVAQQYLLYRWYQLGRCDIAVAAEPGASNHESGRAIDVSNWAAWVDDLAANGWAHDVPGDDVHFDHLASPDLRGTDVLAFQRLWNRNDPAVELDEDGVYGPMTGMAIAMAPAEGFPIGASCAVAGYDATLERLSAPRTLVSGATARVTVTVRNTGTRAWPSGTALVTAEPVGRASVLAADSWTSPSSAQALPAEVGPGGVATFAIDVRAPSLDSDTELSELFTLEAGADHFGAIAMVVTVEAGDGGGCSAGGGGLRGGMALGLLALIRGRSRRARVAATSDRR